MNTQLEELRKKIRVLLPGHEEQIMNLNKQDLVQIIEQSQKLQKPQNANKKNQINTLELMQKNSNGLPPPNKKQAKKQISIRQKIKNLFPDIEKEMDLNVLNEEELKQVYQNANPLIQNNHNNNNKCDYQKEDKFQVKEEKKRKTVNSNGVVNFNQMKRSLIQKIPQYRNQIRNISESEFQVMYNRMSNSHEDEIYIPKTQKKIQYETKPIKSNDKPYFNYHPSQDHVSKKFIAMNNLLNKCQLNKYNQPEILDDEDNPNLNSQYNNNDDDFLRKRGRPKKLKQDCGFNYDNAPNYRTSEVLQQNGFINYSQLPNYMANLPNNVIQEELQPYNPKNQSLINPYDDSPIILNKSHNKETVKQFLFDQKTMKKSQLNDKRTVKLMKQKCKCKITFYLNESDLQDEQVHKKKEGEQQTQQIPQPKQSKQKYQNMLAKIISSLNQSFKNKSWQVS